MEKEIQFNRNTRIYIYGARLRGRFIYDRLVKQGFYNICGFIDINANDIRTQCGKPVLHLEDITDIEKNKRECVVVVAVGNVFAHNDIVKNLLERGFTYIIYKALSDDPNSTIINTLYDTIFDVVFGEYIPDIYIPKAFGMTKSFECLDEYITLSVPVTMLFGLTREFYVSSLRQKDDKLISYVPDRSLLFFTVSKDLMASFENPINVEDWNKFLMIANESREKQDEILCNDSETSDYLNIRYDIYCNLNKILCESPDYFIQSPSIVVWNKLGYFNIEDGNNRAAFLLAKGFDQIPCKMQKKSYESWYNYEQLNELLKEIKEKNVGLLDVFPIDHPFFSGTNWKSHHYLIRKSKVFCEYLWKTGIDPTRINVLEIGNDSGYISILVSKMKGKATVVEPNEKIKSAKKAISKLMNAFAVEYVDRIPCKDYDFEFWNEISEEDYFAIKTRKKPGNAVLFLEIKEKAVSWLNGSNNKITDELFYRQLVGDSIYSVYKL